MDNDKVDEALRTIARELDSMGVVQNRQPSSKSWPNREEAMSHAFAMCLLALEMGPEQIEKKMRWLGCVQGILWAVGVFSINDLKSMNQPEEPSRGIDRQ